ncbi:MAG: NAD(P)-dependent oxidoreductase [Candidatus Nanoarchaeia archaeon]|nr:NAD(P)-dependent oxidoreductase [Candidatus Nanoarchaeia archaeon]
MKKYCITGGLGYIGSSLAKKLLEEGNYVTIIDNASGHNLKEYDAVRTELLKHRYCELISGSIENFDTRILIGMDCVFHLAAISDVIACEENPNECFKTNLELTKKLIQKCLDTKVKNFLFVSSAAVYGMYKKCFEQLELHEVEQINNYGLSKYKAEKEVIKSGLNFKIVRPSNVYGKGLVTKNNVIHLFVNNILNNQPITIHGKGEQMRDFIHLNDVVEALAFLSDTSIKGVFNLGTGKSTRVRTIALKLLPGRNKKMKYLENDRVQTGLGEYEYDVSKLRNLGWTPRIRLDLGIKMCLSEFK